MTSPGEEIKLAVLELCHLIKEPEYDEQLLFISKGYSRFDQLDSAIDWAVSRFTKDPSLFYDLGENFYLWKMDKIMNFPKLRILFRYLPETNGVILSYVEEIE